MPPKKVCRYETYFHSLWRWHFFRSISNNGKNTKAIPIKEEIVIKPINKYDNLSKKKNKSTNINEPKTGSKIAVHIFIEFCSEKEVENLFYLSKKTLPITSTDSANVSIKWRPRLAPYQITLAANTKIKVLIQQISKWSHKMQKIPRD